MLFLLKNRTHSEIYSRDNTTAYSQDLVITGIVMERRGGVGLYMSFPFRVVGLLFPVLYSSLAYPFLQEFTPRKLQPKNTRVQGSILELHGIHSRSYIPTCPSVFSHSHTFVAGKKLRQAKGGYVIRRAHLFPPCSPLHLCTWCLISISHGVCGGKR